MDRSLGELHENWGDGFIDASNLASKAGAKYCRAEEVQVEASIVVGRRSDSALTTTIVHGGGGARETPQSPASPQFSYARR
jgi:hypothetical protein